MGYNAAPYTSWLSRATICESSPAEAIAEYLAAADRPVDPPKPAKKGMFGRAKPVASSDDFRIQLSPGRYGWEWDAGDYGLGVWVFVREDGTTLLLASTWDEVPDASGGWTSRHRCVEPSAIMDIASASLGGRELKDDNWTHDRFADEIQTVLLECAIVRPADIDQVGPGEMRVN
jgi:hypothetical protein